MKATVDPCAQNFPEDVHNVHTFTAPKIRAEQDKSQQL